MVASGSAASTDTSSRARAAASAVLYLPRLHVRGGHGASMCPPQDACCTARTQESGGNSDERHAEILPPPRSASPRDRHRAPRTRVTASSKPAAAAPHCGREVEGGRTPPRGGRYHAAAGLRYRGRVPRLLARARWFVGQGAARPAFGRASWGGALPSFRDAGGPRLTLGVPVPFRRGLSLRIIPEKNTMHSKFRVFPDAIRTARRRPRVRVRVPHKRSGRKRRRDASAGWADDESREPDLDVPVPVYSPLCACVMAFF